MNFAYVVPIHVRAMNISLISFPIIHSYLFLGLSHITNVAVVPILWLSLGWPKVWAEISSIVYVCAERILVMFASIYKQFLIRNAKREAS